MLRDLSVEWAGMNIFCSFMDMPFQKTAYSNFRKPVSHDVLRTANCSATEAVECMYSENKTVGFLNFPNLNIFHEYFSCSLHGFPQLL